MYSYNHICEQNPEEILIANGKKNMWKIIADNVKHALEW